MREKTEETEDMDVGIYAIGQRLLRIPALTGRPSQEVSDRARRRRASPRLRLLLKLGIGVLIVVLLLMMVWVEPVVSRQHPLEGHSDGTLPGHLTSMKMGLLPRSESVF